MSDDNKNREGNPDFEDDLDDLDFDDADLEDGGIEDAGYEDISDEDLEGGDFPAEEEWEEEFAGDEEEQQPAGGRGLGRGQNLYTDTRERKGFNLSFNTMVIIGALLLGGSVLAYTVMSKTAEVNAGKPSVFRSMLNISSVLDGNIFGGSDEKPETATTDTATTQPQQSAGDQGFLDNPDQALPENEQAQIPVVEGAPPAPTPIAPPEDVITPLPNEQVPRGPEDPTALADAANEGDSAQAIIEAAIANRENKADEAPVPVIEETAVPTPIEEPAPVIAEQPAPEPTTAAASEEDKAKIAQAQDRASAAETQVSNLQKQIADLQAKLGTVEGELEAARSSKSDTSNDLEKTVSALKADLKAANDKAESERLARTQAEAEAAKAKKEADVAKKDASAKIASAEKEREAAESAAAAARKAASARAEQTPAPVKKAPAKTASTSSAPKKAPSAEPAKSARWELRAAQPGRAWVSKPGARDMQSVTVGETLPGIGRVTAISYVNGRWTVQGTQGAVAQ